jgi:membrane protein implicated in regulation of membrane protease activity
MSNESKVTAALEAAKAAPAVAGAAASTMTLNHWVALLTLVYVVIQAVYLLRKWWREEREKGGWLDE